jgi:hypothetical protein
MAIYKSRTYLNTSITGLVNIVEHNLGGVPDLFFTEWDGSNEVYVSLMDARIAEVKVLDKDTVQATFAAPFQGYLELLFVEVDNPSDHQRLLNLESKYSKVINLIEDKVSKDQWIQMNTLFSNQITSLQEQVNDLQSQINTLQTDFDSL